MKKELLTILIGFIIIQAVSASITINKFPNSKYFLGQEIDIDAEIGFENLETEEQIFINSLIHCPSRNFNYFRIPLEKSIGKQTVDIPSIDIDENFLGNCYIDINLQNLEGKILEEISTSSFKIKNELSFNFTLNKESYKPGEEILVKGYNQNLREFNLEVVVNDETGDFYFLNKSLVGSSFSINFALDESLSRGMKKISVKMRDEYGNGAEQSKEFEVIQIPRQLILELKQKEIYPYESLEIVSTIFDQSENLMVLDVSYDISDFNHKLIESVEHFSGSEVIVNFLADTPPGNYSVIAEHNNLEAEDFFVIMEFKEIELDIKEGVVSVTNIGNVRYFERLEVNATSGDVVYRIPLSVDVGPGERMVVDVSSELPSENYDLYVSTGEKIYSLNKTFVEDNRPLVKKVSQGLAKVTGSAIIETDKLGNILYLGFFIVLIGFILVFMVQRKFKTKVMGIVDDTVKVQSKKIGGLKDSLGKTQKEKNKIKNMFGQYVDKDLLKKDVSEGIVKKDVSVIFTDIRGHSKNFYKQDVDEISDILNIYFTRSSEVIKSNKGFINKFIGDAVMGLFNAVVDDKDHLIKAIKSGLEIRKSISVLNENLKAKGLEPIEVGIGVDSGVCSVGNFGSKDKVEFTAVGVPVNIAARLESISNGGILIIEKVYNLVKNKIKASYVGEFELRNIQGKVRVYAVEGFVGGGNEAQPESLF